jgi:nicotine blue oxidoreductase
MSSGVAGILLAAGGGSRLGRPKALVEIGGQTLAARGAELLRAGGAAPVIVVTGAVPVALPGVTPVTNPDWRTGMGSSLVAGLTAARDLPPDGGHAVVIALADQPLVGAEAVRRLIAAHAAGATVAVAAYDGRPRNPVLIGREHWDEVLATTTGDAGARPFLRAHPDLVTTVDCTGTGRPDDIDTPSDLARVIDLVEKLTLRLPTVRTEPQAAVTATPQVWETLAPGASTIRSSPLTRAFGGQVMGSMAMARRCRSPCRVSLVNTWSQP